MKTNRYSVRSIPAAVWHWGLGQKKQRPVIHSVCIDASSLCQLQCTACPQTSKELTHTIRTGLLAYGHFTHFVDTHPAVKHIELSNWGEIFLNPALVNIMRYAHEHGIALTAFNGVNLNHASPEQLEALVTCQVQGLTVSIDGASHDTYAVYRKNGHFNTVIKNIQTINEHKKTYGSALPLLTWQFIPMQHNAHELPRARAMAHELGMHFHTKADWSAPRRKKTLREKFAQFTLCAMMWDMPQINWDGTLLGCCANKWGGYGNVLEHGLHACMQSDLYTRTQRALLGKDIMPDNAPCRNCPHYHALKKLRNPAAWFKR